MNTPNLVVEVYEIHPDPKAEESWRKVGRIVLRDGKVSCDPSDSGSLKAMVSDPIIICDRFIYANKEPVDFMEHLYHQYRSPHLKATTAEPLEESEKPPRPLVQDVRGGTAVRKARTEPSWRHAEVFPIIARLIGEEYQRHHRHITAHEIAAALLQDGEARALIDGARELQHDRSPEHVASNMVAWFSQRITVGQSEWRRAFKRTQVDGQWAYRPTQTVPTG